MTFGAYNSLMLTNKQTEWVKIIKIQEITKEIITIQRESTVKEQSENNIMSE